MFDQDDMDNLGRAAQLYSQEGTRQAILDLQNKEAGMPKCPWCAGPIEKNVSKCRHCASDIAWVDGEQCKPEDKDKVTYKQREQKIREARAREEKRRVDNQEVTCKKCSKKIKRGDSVDNGDELWCEPCNEADTKFRIYLNIVSVIIIFGWLWWRILPR